MSENLTVELIRASPAALWVLFALIAFLTLQPVIRRKLDNVKTVRAQGVEINFVAALLKAATTDTQEGDVQPGATPTPAPEHQTSDSERLSGVSRLDHAATFIAGRRILWVDDRHRRNVSLTTLFKGVGVSVDEATTTNEAITMLKRTEYDLVITDGYRPEHGSKRADEALIEEVGRRTHRPPVILFTNRSTINEGTSHELFAYTSDSDTLVQYVVDVMERHWFGIPPRRPRRRQ